MILGFSHTQLVVRDVERSASWYAAVLGTEPFIRGEIDSGPYIGLRHPAAGFVVGLQTATPVQLRTLGSTSIDHLSFRLADLATLVAHRAALLAAGIDVGEVFDEAVSHNVRVCDPDGLVVELTAPRSR